MNEPIIHVQHLRKTYGDVVAVKDLSLTVFRGELFGLLGPNGAGKTTTIRILMDIYAPDAGEIQVLGKRPRQVRSRVGYLPEERGLYRKQRVMDVLLYLAELKGMPRKQAREQASYWLERVDLQDWAQHKVEDLSRGMQQKLQFVASVVHDPELLILDEPFQGLDPVNVELVKAILDELRDSGKTILLSAHQMNLVEELCNRIVLIHQGEAVLYGEVDAIKRRYAPNRVKVRTNRPLEQLPGVRRIERQEDGDLLELAEGVTPQSLLRELVRRDIPIEMFEVAPMSLNDIFIAVVQGESSPQEREARS